jgi:hypothetical protein
MKPQPKEIPGTRKENAENCSGQTSHTEAITNGENDEDEWTVRYFRQNVRQIRPSRTSMEQNNQRDGSDRTSHEPVEGTEEQSQAQPERPARTIKIPAWLQDYE